MYNADKNTVTKLRGALQTVLSAAPGERFVGSTSLSNNSWTTTAKAMDDFMTNGIIKYDGYKMGPLNSQAYSYQTNVPKIIAADIKKINNQIVELNRKHKLNLPKAWVNPTSLEVIAPYIITKKVPKATKLKYGGWLDKYQDGGDYNMQRALELGYTPDETGHWGSVDSETGMWLKSKQHPTAWMEYMYGQLDPEVANNYDVIINPEGYFGKNQLQYVPKRKKGGVKSQGEGYYDYINGYSGIFANGGTKSKENSWLNKYK
jgi:hypothetical protein